jgi:hypothetical protein
MRGQALNYKGRSPTLSRFESLNALASGLAPMASIALWLLAAALVGWAVSIALGIWGREALRSQAPWKPFAIDTASPQRATAPVASAPSSTGALQLFGIADERAYFKSGAKTLSVTEGDTLPGGERVKQIGNDTVVILSASGGERTIALFKPLTQKSANSVTVSTQNVVGSAESGAIQSCRLSAIDRSAAIWIDPAVATALVGESKALARMFAVIDPARGGLRAQATGGTTALFSIADGDVLLRADGQPLRSGDAVAAEIIVKVQRGDAVIVEGERAGAARRWVFAPVKCRV